MPDDGFVRLPDDGTGKAVRTFTETVDGVEVHQEVVADTFNGGQVLPDQTGAGAVLTFTFAAAVQLLWVRSDGEDVRADPFGGTPSASTGIICEDGVPNPITVQAAVVKVFAPAGATVSVWGFRY